MPQQQTNAATKLHDITALLFDVDGTLFSSEGIIHEVYREEFVKFQALHGLPHRIPDLAAIMAQIGKPVVEIFRNLVPELSPEQGHSLSENILENFLKRIYGGAGEHYPLVTETLTELHRRGYHFYAVSNGRLRYVEAVLKSNGIFHLFDAVPAVNNTTIRNKSELVAHVLQTYHLAPSRAVVIGDRTSDRDAAADNGCPFIACTYGHGNAEEQAGAVLYIDHISALLDYLPGPPENR